MPIFDYKCSKCGNVVRDVYVVRHDAAIACQLCDVHVVMDKLPAVPNMHLFPIDGIHLKHVCPGGKIFRSKNEMKQYARDNNVELGALL